MPALKGSLTYTRFYVDAERDGKLPEDFHARFLRSVRLRTIKPLIADEDDLERSGWCKLGDPFGLDLVHDDVFFNEYLNLGFRTDRWQIPTPMLKERMREAEAAYLQKKGRERLSRAEKAELKELVSRKLRRQLSPVTRVIDVSWSLNDGLVRFFSHAGKPAGAMSELFHKTFGLKLIPESPYTLAARIGLDKAQEDAWQELAVTVLATEEALAERQARLDDLAAEEEA